MSEFALSQTDLAVKQETLAAASALAVVTVRGRRSLPILVANNNSICRAFQSSKEFARLCEPFCGEAVMRAFAETEKGEIARYRCHAGLRCVALPTEFEQGEHGAIIGGRAFVSGDDYRALVERLRVGEWRELASAETFQNVLFSSEADLNALAASLKEVAPLAAKIKIVDEPDEEAAREISDDESRDVGTSEGTAEEARRESREAVSNHEATSNDATFAAKSARDTASRQPQRAEEADVSRKATVIAMPARSDSFKDACRAMFRPLLEKYNLNSLTLVMRRNGNFVVGYATGKFQHRVPLVMLDPTNPKLIRLVAASASDESLNQFEAFPLIVDGEVRGALIVENAQLNDDVRRALTEFCREAALPLEVLRLREELEQRRREESYLQSFIERLNTLEPTAAYAMILRYFAESLRAERGSLLLYDENSDELVVKAALGARAEIMREARVKVGESIAGYVLQNARPLVVRDLRVAGVAPAPAERRYKTNSFISFPIIAGGRRVGVLNMTDRIGGGIYDDADLSLLEAVAPQIALAIDRAEWHNRATQFELLSITDPLTGLLNRRYLEERVNEEVKRSKRYHYPMSFMMLDVDDFKKYNDQNGHQAGDEALKLAAECLKTTLRGADIPARYGGEEFCVLLPQTTLDEARFIAERIRNCIRHTQFPHGRKQPQGFVSVSIGIAALSQNLDTSEAIIHAADDALYVAKRRGKDRVELAEE